MKRKLSKAKRDRLILVWFSTAGIIVTLWLVVIQSHRDRLKQMETETENLVDQIESTKRLLAKEDQFADTLATLRKNLEARESGMATGDRYIWFDKMLSNFKLKYNVDIPQVSPETVSPVGLFPEFPYQAATFKVSGSAHYFDFGRFLRDFENTYPYIRVQNLEMSPSANHAERITFIMDVVTLIKPEKPVSLPKTQS